MDLSIMQSVIPDFTIENFNLFDEIICLKWEKVFDDVLWVEYRNLILEMKSCTDYRIQMECKKVDSFRFRGNGKISGFYVKDMSPMGYETGVKYEVGDYENDEIELEGDVSQDGIDSCYSKLALNNDYEAFWDKIYLYADKNMKQ